MNLKDCAANAAMFCLFIALVVVIGVFTARLTKENDGKIEEAMEQIVEHTTGVTVDLTPESLEKDKKEEEDAA